MRNAIILVSVALLASCGDSSDQSVPKGTVISWIPPKESVMKDKNMIVYPKGWQRCDLGEGPAPVFLGAVTDEDYLANFPDGLRAGTAKHAHDATAAQTATIEQDIDKGGHKNAAGAGHTHGITVAEAAHIPPYLKVILLCRQ